MEIHSQQTLQVKRQKQRLVEEESSNCGHSDNRLLKEFDHSGCLALYNFNILDVPHFVGTKHDNAPI